MPSRFVIVLLIGLAGTLPGPPAQARAGGGDTAAASEKSEAQQQARRFFLEGKKRFALRQFRRALKLFSQAYDAVPLPGFLFNIGQCHRFLGDCTRAVFFYSGFIRENPNTPDAKFVQQLIARCKAQQELTQQKHLLAGKYFEEGRKSLTLRQFDHALSQFTKAYRVQPRSGYLYHIAKSHQGLRQYKEAIHFYSAYLQQNPGSPTAKDVKRELQMCRQELKKEQERRQQTDRINRNLNLKGAGKPGEGGAPVYKKWWFWTTIVATVTAAAVGLGVGLTQAKKDDPLPDAPWTINWRQ
ncbi:MAG: tetratricopeptide repeat protein [bacterium]